MRYIKLWFQKIFRRASVGHPGTKDEFKQLVANLLISHQRFCFNQYGRADVKTRYYNAFRSFWDNALVSLEIEALMGLARSFDPPKRKQPRLAFSYFDIDVKTEFANHWQLIRKLKKCRDNLIAHTDLKTAGDFQSFLRKNGLPDLNILLLFDRVVEVIESKKNQYGLADDFRSQFQNEKLAVQQQMQSFIPAEYREV